MKWQILFVLTLAGCSSLNFKHTVNHVDIQKFMGAWFVWAGRTTFLERGAHNSIEKYTWNENEQRIDVDFTFRRGSFDGKVKSLPQKAWIYNTTTNAHWKVQPFWPFKLDYLIIDMDPDYTWTAIGVPSGSYLWIMGRVPIASDEQIAKIIQGIKNLGYPVNDVIRVPQRLPNIDKSPN